MRLLGCRLPVLLTVVASLLAAAPAAQAMRADQVSHTASSRGDLQCYAQVVAVDSDQRLVEAYFHNGRIVETYRSARLPYDPVGMGHFSSKSTDRATTLKIDAITANGTPRILTATLKKSGSQISVSSRPLDQHFTPRLFADTFSYRVYTVNDAGVLQRWFLSRYGDGSIRYARGHVIGAGFGSLTALTNYGTLEVNGSLRDVLYATTKSGALKQYFIKVDQPDHLRQKVLKRTGYAGVTGLSTSYCNSTWLRSVVVAVKPASHTATWTTVSHLTDLSRVKASRHGQVTGGGDWDLHATY